MTRIEREQMKIEKDASINFFVWMRSSETNPFMFSKCNFLGKSINIFEETI